MLLANSLVTSRSTCREQLASLSEDAMRERTLLFYVLLLFLPTLS